MDGVSTYHAFQRSKQGLKYATFRTMPSSRRFTSKLGNTQEMLDTARTYMITEMQISIVGSSGIVKSDLNLPLLCMYGGEETQTWAPCFPGRGRAAKINDDSGTARHCQWTLVLSCVERLHWRAQSPAPAQMDPAGCMNTTYVVRNPSVIQVQVRNMKVHVTDICHSCHLLLVIKYHQLELEAKVPAPYKVMCWRRSVYYSKFSILKHCAGVPLIFWKQDASERRIGLTLSHCWGAPWNRDTRTPWALPQ